MLGDVSPVMPAGIEVELVWDAARLQQIVKRFCACLETEIILGPAIKLNLHPRR